MMNIPESFTRKKTWQKHWGNQFFIGNRHENRTWGGKKAKNEKRKTEFSIENFSFHFLQ